MAEHTTVHALCAAVKRNAEDVQERIRSDFWRYLLREEIKVPESMCGVLPCVDERREIREHTDACFFLRREAQEAIFQKTIKLLICKRWGNGWKPCGREDTSFNMPSGTGLSLLIFHIFRKRNQISKNGKGEP